MFSNEIIVIFIFFVGECLHIKNGQTSVKLIYCFKVPQHELCSRLFRDEIDRILALVVFPSGPYLKVKMKFKEVQISYKIFD